MNKERYADGFTPPEDNNPVKPTHTQKRSPGVRFLSTQGIIDHATGKRATPPMPEFLPSRDDKTHGDEVP